MARPFPQPRSITRSPGARSRNRRSMSLRIRDPSSGGAIDSCRASAWSSASRYLVCSANAARGTQVEVAARRVEDVRWQPLQRAPPFIGAMRPRQSGHSTRSKRLDEIIAAHRSIEHRVEPLRPARPRVVGRERAGGVAEGRAFVQGLPRGARGPWRGPARRQAGRTAPSRVVSTSRSAGRSDATIGRPICEVLEQLQRRREPFGESPTPCWAGRALSPSTRRPPPCVGATSPVTSSRSETPASRASCVDTRAIGLARVTADDQPTNTRERVPRRARRRPRLSRDTGGRRTPRSAVSSGRPRQRAPRQPRGRRPGRQRRWGRAP